MQNRMAEEQRMLELRKVQGAKEKKDRKEKLAAEKLAADLAANEKAERTQEVDTAENATFSANNNASMLALLDLGTSTGKDADENSTLPGSEHKEEIDHGQDGGFHLVSAKSSSGRSEGDFVVMLDIAPNNATEVSIQEM